MAAGSGGKGSARSIKSEKLGAQLEAYRKRLHAFILRRLRHKADTEDAVQIVYERVLSYLDRGGSIKRLPSLIYRTALNLVIDKTRGRDRNVIDYVSDRGEPDVPQDSQRNEPQETVEAEEMLKCLEEQLSPLHKEFLEYWNWGTDEIAATKGITRRTVETYRTRLRNACKAAWKGK